MRRKGLWWKIPLAITGIASGIVVLLLIAVTCVLCVPSWRASALEKGVVIAQEKTGLDIDLGGLYLSPFHHSPFVLYHAYKGTADLPIEIQIDSLFVGHRGRDTLVYTRALRLRAKALTSQAPIGLELPIVVERLYLAHTTFHSDSLIASVGVDAIVGMLDVSSPAINISEGRYPLHGLLLHDVFCGIDLRPTSVDTLVQKPSPLKLAFDIPDGELNDIHFRLTPLGMDISVGELRTNALVDVGANRYDARKLNVSGFAFDLNKLHIPVDSIYGSACADIAHNLITSPGLYVRSNPLGAKASLRTTEMDLSSMRIETSGDAEFRGSRASLRACYDIDEERYDASVHIDRVNLSPFLKDSTRVILAGDIEAKGKGIQPKRPLSSHIKVRLDDAVYGPYDLSRTTIDLATDSTLSLSLDTRGLNVSASSPMPLFALIDRFPPLVKAVRDSAVLNGLTSLQDLTVLDTIRPLIPAMDIALRMTHGSPIQPLMDSLGLDIQSIDLSLASDTAQTGLSLSASVPEIYHSKDSMVFRLPAIEALLGVRMQEGQTDASLCAQTQLTDGAMSFYGLCTDMGLRLYVQREENRLSGEGKLTLDSISFNAVDLGSRAIDIKLSPSLTHAHALRADIQTESIPVDIIDGFVHLPDIALRGAVKAKGTVDGLPRQADISAEVKPIGISAEYKPYEIGLSLGETPIIMEHNHVDLNGLPVYGADSTFIALSGGLDLNTMRMDVTLEADSFAPVKMTRGGPLPVYGDLATDIRGRVSGPLDSIEADVDVTILPTTDITYPIDKKNLAQVKPHGTVSVNYQMAQAEPLSLGGRINVDDGFIRYSPKAYPIMPFHVDSGSHVLFQGPIGKTQINVSASQQVKADVESSDEETRRVDFRTGVRINGKVDSIGMQSIGFFLEAPNDEPVTRELSSIDEETREGLAATLLATGMYVGESNVAAQRDGYALSSIINSRINAAMANSKMGKFVDIDFSSGQSTHASGKTNDMNITISKSFFKDKLRLTLGSTITDNPEVNETNGLLSNFSADYKLTKEGNVLLRLYSQRDYNNVLEGELYKAGLAVRATKEWRRQELYRGDSICRVYGLTADAGVAYRSNNSIGPDLTLKSTMTNVLGRGELFTLKGNGAYYWALRDRHPGDPKKTDTYKLGLNASLVFPYLHWTGDHIPSGDTRYMFGYQYENIAGGYGVHKLSGSFTYFIHSPHSPHITHAFTPFSLSVVMMKAEAEDLMDKAAEYPQLIKVLAGDEFVPSIAYNFIYDDYRAKRAVNTFLNLGVKESGNLINALYCAFGHKWGELNKPLGKITFNQFVKLSMELRNKFNLTDRISIATRLFAGANIPLGNSFFAPLSEAFYAGGPNSLRAAAPYAYGPGNFYSAKYNQNFFHAGDVKLEANFEFRFPIVWKLYGAAFLDAGNVWNWYSTVDLFKAAGLDDYIERLELPEALYDGIINNPEFAKQIALGTGAGLRLDIDGLVVRLDIGVGIHAPYQTFRYDKEGKPDPNQPINTYFNIPSALDAIRINFGIGYPF